MSMEALKERVQSLSEAAMRPGTVVSFDLGKGLQVGVVVGREENELIVSLFQDKSAGKPLKTKNRRQDVEDRIARVTDKVQNLHPSVISVPKGKATILGVMPVGQSMRAYAELAAAVAEPSSAVG